MPRTTSSHRTARNVERFVVLPYGGAYAALRQTFRAMRRAVAVLSANMGKAKAEAELAKVKSHTASELAELRSNSKQQLQQDQEILHTSMRKNERDSINGDD